MIAVNQLKIEMRFDDKKAAAVEEAALRKKTAKVLGIPDAQIREIMILKHSIDARKKPRLFHVYTLGVCLKGKLQEEQAVKRSRNANVALFAPKPYIFPESMGSTQ